MSIQSYNWPKKENLWPGFEILTLGRPSCHHVYFSFAKNNNNNPKNRYLLPIFEKNCIQTEPLVHLRPQHLFNDCGIHFMTTVFILWLLQHTTIVDYIIVKCQGLPVVFHYEKTTTLGVQSVHLIWRNVWIDIYSRFSTYWIW